MKKFLEQAQKDSTLATGVHAPNITSTAHKNLGHIICFNCNKKGHYIRKCPEPRKNSNIKD